MVGKTQYCQDISPCQPDLEVRCKSNRDASKLCYGYCKPILKFRCRGKRPGIADTLSREKNEVGGPTPPDSETYYKATVTQTVWCR